MHCRIGGRRIGDGTSPYIIAEIGSNHDGEKQTALELIEACADAGVDAVKFQRFTAETIVVDDRELVEDPDNSLYRTFERNELPVAWLPDLRHTAKQHGIDLLVTPFSTTCVEEVVDYVPAFKIASGTLSHHKFLRHIAQHDKPVLLSTGMHNRDEVSAAIDVLRSAGVNDLVLMHCVSSYPTDSADANLQAIATLRTAFDSLVGYSDHTLDPLAAPGTAASLGAAVIEKHVTLNRGREGLDHSFAIEPDELTALIDHVRETHTMLGSGEIRVADVETDGRYRSKRLLYAARDLKAGTRLDLADVVGLRPGDNGPRGVGADELDRILGRTLTNPVKEGEPIRVSVLAE